MAPGLLAQEIKQQRPFADPAVEAYLSLVRSADQLMHATAQLLRPHKLSQPQYNILRILAGASEPLCIGTIGERLVAAAPDVTRLVDRLEQRGLVERTRHAQDRRQVLVGLTAQGQSLASDPQLQAALVQLHRTQFSRLSSGQLTTFIAILEALRAP